MFKICNQLKMYLAKHLDWHMTDHYFGLPTIDEIAKWSLKGIYHLFQLVHNNNVPFPCPVDSCSPSMIADTILYLS